ncbi:hypothetical protein AB0J72_15265 [Dactylosporangium sp. NPDC049742]|uniref:hypothetical protein n=1 Tax=Dactylosporangium sp. NPDC049742 TaxID=3154737 RepID=UPI00342C0FF3
MGVWLHDDKLYEVSSGYSLPDDAWQYELTGLTGAPGTGPYLAITIPDATPDDGPFTPMPAHHVRVRAGGGQVPWPILTKFIDLVESSGDLVAEDRNLATELPLTLNAWQHDDRRYEVNQFHFGDNDSWCYELYEVKPDAAGNDYIDVQIPDTQPENGPFVPGPADHVTLTMHGNWSIPWPVFRRFVDAVQASGDIVDA